MNRFLWLGFFLSACATASQRASNAAALRQQEGHASVIFRTSAPAFDALGARYRLVSATSEALCFEALVPSAAGAEGGIIFYLARIDADGKEHWSRHSSSRVLATRELMTLRETNYKEANAAAVGMNETGSTQTPQASGLQVPGFGDTDAVQHPGATNELPSVADSQMLQSFDYQRIRSVADLQVCFAASEVLGPQTRYLVMQRGELALMNPDPPRAVWRVQR